MCARPFFLDLPGLLLVEETTVVFCCARFFFDFDALEEQGPRFELYCYWHRGGQEMRQYHGAASMIWWKDYQTMKMCIVEQVEEKMREKGLKFGYAHRPDPLAVREGGPSVDTLLRD